MANKKVIPSYNLYETLHTALRVEFCRLEDINPQYDTALPHRHNYYEVLLFTRGGGEHDIDFRAYPVQAFDLHFLSPEQVHLLTIDDTITGYVISFAREFLDEGAGSSVLDGLPFFNNPYSAPLVQLPTEADRQLILSLFAQIEAEFTGTREDKASVLASYLTILLITAKRLYAPQEVSEQAAPTRTDLTRRFKQLVEKNFTEVKSVSEYATLLNITPGHLNDTVQKDTGRTASDIIHERVTLEAKRLLYHSDKSVKEVAYTLNYDDPSYFAKFFKKQVGLTPEVFRQQAREKYR